MLALWATSPPFPKNLLLKDPAGTLFDYGNHIQSALQLLPGGYIGVYNISAGNGWQQLTAQQGPYLYSMRARLGSRRERRRTPCNQWLNSLVVSSRQPSHP